MNYKTIACEASAEFTEKRSRFICFLFPVADEVEVLALIERIRRQYPDARHVVHAYILKNGISRFSDDGEPQGTAGKPVLATLERRGICDCLAVVVRYFGGILLGAGGLMRAYAASVRLALEKAEIAKKTLCSELEVEIGYHLQKPLEALATRLGGRRAVCKYGELVTLTLLLPKELEKEFVCKAYELCGGKFEYRILGETYFLNL